MITEPVTSNEFEVYVQCLAQFAIDYYNNPTVYNVSPDVSQGFLYNNMPKNGPEYPESFNVIYEDIKKKIMPGLTHWQHPNFFGYYPIGRCYPDIYKESRPRRQAQLKNHHLPQNAHLEDICLTALERDGRLARDLLSVKSDVEFRIPTRFCGLVLATLRQFFSWLLPNVTTRTRAA
ncbi:hypothetical protein NECAME_17088 [Necator americanus]|uniref:Uncharacterized protein n=1 Tax=Necator americanus TaxID=51031 RepID=W2TU70_NECAM|nr:hypothetical protein NECAME_17088 [Necator americanus]ETN84602.1 hypothetical protein NECAME_17088 [Necator americanus]